MIQRIHGDEHSHGRCSRQVDSVDGFLEDLDIFVQTLRSLLPLRHQQESLVIVDVDQIIPVLIAVNAELLRPFQGQF